MQTGLSPVRQVLKENLVRPAAPSTSASDVPAWFVEYQQQTDKKLSKQEQIIEQQGKQIVQQGKEIVQQSEEIKRLSRTVKAYEDLEVRKLKESGRAKILTVLNMQQSPHHWNTFVAHLTSRQQSMLREHKISHRAVLATSCDNYQQQGNDTAHDPVAEVAANAVMALPKADRIRFIELFDVVSGDGVYKSIMQGWNLQAWKMVHYTRLHHCAIASLCLWPDDRDTKALINGWWSMGTTCT